VSDATRRVADFAGLNVPVIEITGDAPGRPRRGVMRPATWNSHAWHALAS
jgi:hypothetical protein